MAEPLTTKQDVLKAVDWLKRSDMSPFRQAQYDAIAAWLHQACVAGDGHHWKQHGEQACRHCGQRRAEATNAATSAPEP